MKKYMALYDGAVGSNFLKSFGMVETLITFDINNSECVCAYVYVCLSIYIYIRDGHTGQHFVGARDRLYVSSTTWWDVHTHSFINLCSTNIDQRLADKTYDFLLGIEISVILIGSEQEFLCTKCLDILWQEIDISSYMLLKKVGGNLMHVFVLYTFYMNCFVRMCVPKWQMMREKRIKCHHSCNSNC